MSKNMRQAKIVEEFDSSPFLTVQQISKKLNCSEMTVRRDLTDLEKANIVKRFPGGAVLINHAHQETPPVPARQQPFGVFRDEVNAVGKAAISLIQPNNIICIDSGTSSRSVVRFLPPDFPITIITTSLFCSFEIASNQNAQIIQVGGSVHQMTHSTINDLSLDSVGNLSADIAFLSTRSLRIPGGAYEHTLTLIPPKQFLASLARKVVLCVDHTKFGLNSLCIATEMQDIDTIITDAATPENDISKLVTLGKEVIVVEVPGGDIVSHYNKPSRELG